MTQQSADTQPRRMIRFARAEQARIVDSETMPYVGLTDSDQSGFARLATAGYGDGSVLRLLFEDSVSGLSLAYAWFKPNFMLPIHSHSADCAYYVIAGEAHVGTEILKAGDVFFIPSGAKYSYNAGPDGIQVLEIRNKTHFDFNLSNTGTAFFDRAEKMIAANLTNWRQQQPPDIVARFPD